ncbi:hypothetical protein [Neochlamydia sp. AcF84]|nr:hypothetical protein [Neochlamydia sp. AcF84]
MNLCIGLLISLNCYQLTSFQQSINNLSTDLEQKQIDRVIYISTP